MMIKMNLFVPLWPKEEEMVDEDEPVRAQLGGWHICDRCDGDGKVVHPALSVWTSEDRYEDPDGFEDMMNGAYDRPCAKCGGSGKIREKDDEEYRQRLADARLCAMEDGDPEVYYNPELGLY